MVSDIAQLGMGNLPGWLGHKSIPSQRMCLHPQSTAMRVPQSAYLLFLLGSSRWSRVNAGILPFLGQLIEAEFDIQSPWPSCPMGGHDGYSGFDETAQHEDFLITIRHPDYGVRNVTYFVVDGDAIIDGDVHFGTVEELLSYRVPDDTDPDDDGDDGSELDRRALSLFQGRKTWPRGIWKYTYDSDSTERILKARVNEGFSRWKQKAPWATFAKIKKNSRRKGIVTITAKSSGCYATVGYKGTTEYMNLNLSPGGCGPDQATHEIGHSLGRAFPSFPLLPC